MQAVEVVIPEKSGRGSVCTQEVFLCKSIAEGQLSFMEKEVCGLVNFGLGLLLRSSLSP